MFKKYKIKEELNKIMDHFKNKDIDGLNEMQNSDPSVLISNTIFIAKTIIRISPVVNKIIKDTFSVITRISSFNIRLAYYSNELKQTSEVLKQSSENLSAAMEETSASIEQVSKAMAENTASVDMIASNTDKVSKNFQINDEILSKINFVNGDISTNSKVMEENMNSLSSIIESIQEIVSGIGKTASDTNLLALNASIEAARAGENGKGFAVVANEIKKLSKNTKQQLDFIQNFMAKIEEASTKSNDSIKNTLNSIENMNKYAKEMEEYFKESKASVKGVFEGIEAISSNMEELNAVSEEISASTAEISKDAEKLTYISENIYKSAGEIQEVGFEFGKIENDISNLSKLTSKLNKEEYFRISNKDLINIMDKVIIAHKNWVRTLEEMTENMIVKPIQLNSHQCNLGHFYYSVEPVNEEVLNVWNEIENVHDKLHNMGHVVIKDIEQNNKEAALQHYREAKEISKVVIEKFNKIISIAERLEKENTSIF